MTSPTSRETQFWYGSVKGVADSFFRGTRDDITFSVGVALTNEELAEVPGSELLPRVAPGGGHVPRLVLNGRIERQGDDGSMLLERVTINSKPVFARSSGGIDYLPSLDASPEDKQNSVRALLASMNDCVYVVPSGRYVTAETPRASDPPALAPATFKNWLHYLSLSRDGYPVFAKIKQWFNEAPFGYGEISFLREPDALEIMVEDSSHLRLPIDAKGTGVQQILFLLSCIASSEAKIIGIEEPELNLSFANQDAMISKLMTLVQDVSGPPHQLLVTSHSDHIGSRAELKQYHIDHDGSESHVRRFNAADRRDLFPRARGKRVVIFGG